MKKIVISVVLFFSAGILTAQNYTWITPNQTYLKMYVVDDGIYRINRTDFENAGINTTTIDPRTVKVFYKGNQIPIYFFGENDGIFDANDYLDFFGTRNYGGLTNVYDSYNQVSYVKDEYFNMYSDTNIYWINWGGANGIRYMNYNNSSSTPYPLDYYYAKLHFEKDTYYSLGESYSGTDYRNFSNDYFLGEGWYWRLMQFNNTQTDTFSTPLKILNTQNCLLKIFAYPNNRNTSISNEHKIILSINNNFISDTIKSDDFKRFDTTVAFPSSYLNQSTVNNYTLKYLPVGFSSGQIHLDLLEILYPHRFEFDNNIISFKSTVTDSSSKQFKIKGFIPSNEIKIYDVKNNLLISNYQTSADTLIFSGKGNGNFEIINKSITKKPFRIKQKQVPDLVSTSNGVDYLIIYNKLLVTQAEQLRIYRNSHDGFRAFKAEVEDIYDIFNYGLENPVGVKNFTKYVYDNWQTPKFKFLCLFGRGSLDPKKILVSSVYYQNLVPVYGNPPTDGYFANMNPGSFAYTQQVSVGRLPAYSVQEAQDMVNKIIAYDDLPLNPWLKEPLFITGGYEFNDQQTFITQSESLVINFISPQPYSASPQRIYLNDSSGFVTFNYEDSIINSINRGTLLVNYIGHAGNAYWDYCFENPIVLSNGNLLPLILSMTCFTGKNAEANKRGYAEKFMLLPNKGCLGFISCTGWSFSGSGNDFNIALLQSFAQDSLRRIGDILKRASLKMDTNNFASRNTINCYNLVGDPASKLKSPSYPEFDIQSNDYELDPVYPSVRKNINLKIFPKNLGTYADSVKLRFQLYRSGQNYGYKDTIIRNFGYKKTLNYDFKLDSAGFYLMKVILDVANWYPSELKTNNVLNVSLTLKNSAFIPLKPEDNQSINTDSVEIVGLNPQVNFISNTIKLFVQLDTTSGFNSPLNQVLFKTNINGAVTKFKLRIPVLDSNIVYFWRLSAIVNSDTVGWSESRKFKFNSSMSNFSVRGKQEIRTGEQMFIDTLITIYKNKTQQYSYKDYYQTSQSQEGIKLSKYKGKVMASSFGGDPWEPSYIIVNDKNFEFVTSANWGGLYLFKINKYNAVIIEKLHIHFNTTTSSDSVTNFLNTFDSTHIMAGVKLVPVGVNANLNTDARNKLKEFGSIYADSINIISWERWSIVCYKKLPNPVVSEGYNKTNWIAVNSIIEPDFNYSSGYVNSFLGPAQNWKYFKWDQILYPYSGLNFDVYGINTNNQTVLLYSNLTNNSLVNLDTLNAYQYPNLKLVTDFNVDTINGVNSSILKSLTFKYYPPAELVIDSIALYKPEPVINDGDEIKVNANYYNVGYRNAYGVASNWYVYNGAGNKIILKSDTLHSVLQIDSMKNSSTKLIMNYFPGFGKKPNSMVTLYFEVKALGQQNDYYDFNNTAFVNILMRNGPSMGKLDVYADGVKLQGGEFVKQKPEITVRLVDYQNFNLVQNDTSSFKVYVNNVLFNFGQGINPNLRKPDVENKRTNSSVTFSPDLKEGVNDIKFIIKTNENSSDTADYSVTVSNEFLIRDMVNYPNPMRNETDFLFTVTGLNKPSECKIKIYTVSGRLVKTISSLVNTGYNQIHWDGRDNENEYMANGVYFYKMIIDDDSKKETSIQKLVILK